MDLILSLLQQMCVYLVLAYLLSKTPLVLPLLSISKRRGHQFSVYVLFSLFCIMGTYFGLQINDAIANTRAIGAVMGGLFGGPVIGFLVGLTGGLHRYTLGGFTDLACAISTTLEGLVGGLMHSYLVRKDKSEWLFNPWMVFCVTLVAEIIQMITILAVAKPFDDAYRLVSAIAAPMIIANSVGAMLFMSILLDRKAIVEKYSAAFSRRALLIAERTVGVLSSGLTPTNADKIARIVYEETKVGAVSITDCDKILAFVGIGDDHHKPDTPISSPSTLESISKNDIIYLDGVERPYQCSISDECKLGSALIIPLRQGSEVVGTIKLYEPKHKFFSTINMSMAEGIAELLSSQLLYGDYQQQQTLLSQAKIKLLHAQVNPHFLFNALNTISAITRKDPDKARQLIQHLSQFFRSNLKQNIEHVQLKDELAHVNAYLTIEKARFSDRLEVEVDIAPQYLELYIPSFTLQPLVENAIKHGISQQLDGGKIRIYTKLVPHGVLMVVEDDAGLYQKPPEQHSGLGLEIVDKRLIQRLGKGSALQIESKPQQYTRMSFLLPSDLTKED
ncbi:sensor histidine kinase [Vibrio sp. SCSIO 43136]|uniref:sensor histidine kinase n=1 Tax=Vibrio sp. SCSIO 43136 TaxID=2819101 RepID=UPI002075AD10|nr:sensor histidine kinase [Vibrio sp. SCSIO 43136]USD64826.1 sensor histidine kinase [Vibrio sp. SCSIO 43136]